MYEPMERIERQIETLTTILHEWRERQRGFGRRNKRENQDVPESSDRLDHGEQNLAVMNKSNIEQKPKVESLSRGEQNYGTRGQSVKVRIWRILGRK